MSPGGYAKYVGCLVRPLRGYRRRAAVALVMSFSLAKIGGSHDVVMLVPKSVASVSLQRLSYLRVDQACDWRAARVGFPKRRRVRGHRDGSPRDLE